MYWKDFSCSGGIYISFRTNKVERIEFNGVFTKDAYEVLHFKQSVFIQ